MMSWQVLLNVEELVFLNVGFLNCNDLIVVDVFIWLCDSWLVVVDVEELVDWYCDDDDLLVVYLIVKVMFEVEVEEWVEVV